MASTFTLILKDGATATVSVAVSLNADARDRVERTATIENILGGYLAGASTRIVQGELTSATASDVRVGEGGVTQ